MNRFSLAGFLCLIVLLLIPTSCTKQQENSSHDRMTVLEGFSDNPDSLQSALHLLTSEEKNNGYLDYLYMKAYANIGDYHRMDSVHRIASEKFKKQQNRLMLFDTEFSYASSLNGAQQFEQAYIVLQKLLNHREWYRAGITNHQNKTFSTLANMALYEMAYNQLSRNHLNEASNTANQAKAELIETKDTSLLIETYNLSGLIYKRMSQFDKAIDDYQHALEFVIQQGNNHQARIILNNIASLYTELEENEKALYIARRMVKDFPKRDTTSINDKIYHLMELNTLGVLLSNVNLNRNAIDTFRIALHEMNEKTPSGLKLLIYSNYAKSLAAEAESDSAIYYYQRAMQYKKETSHDFNKANLNYLYGSLLSHKADSLKEAKQYLKEAIDFYRKYPSKVLAKALSNLAELENKLNPSNPQAYALMKEAFNAEQKLMQQDFQNKLSRFEVKFQTKEKELKIIELNRKNGQEKAANHIRIIIFITSLLVISILVAVLLYYLRKNKIIYTLNQQALQDKIARKDLESKLLMNEINQRLTEQYVNGLEDSNKRTAKTLHDGICNQLLTIEMILDHKAEKKLQEQITQIREEVRTLSHELSYPDFKNAQLSQVVSSYVSNLQKAHVFDINCFIDEKIDKEPLDCNQHLEAYRIIQESIGNIIKHADARHVYLTLRKEDNIIDVTIEDDGKGFRKEAYQEGIGIRTMKERTRLIHGNIEIDSIEGKGTIVHFWFPCLSDNQS